MNAFFEIVVEALKKYAAEIIAALLFSFSLWKFPKLRTWLTRYRGNQIPLSEEPQKQKEAPKNIEAVSSSSQYYERARKYERRAERWLRISELFSKLRYLVLFPFMIFFTSLTGFIIVSIILSILEQYASWIVVRYFVFRYLVCCTCIAFFEAPLVKFMSSRSNKALDEAKTLYEQGAEHGEVESMKRTAQLLYEQKKYLKAAYWYEKLAEQCDFDAMYSLVDAYNEARDGENAYMWYQVIKLFGKEKEYKYYHDGHAYVPYYLPDYQMKQIDMKAQKKFGEIKERNENIRSENYA